MNIPDYQHQENRKEFDRLKAAGYEFECNADEYSVAFKGAFIAGAGVLLPREKPLHWKYAEADRRDNLDACVRASQQHERANTGPDG